MSTIQELYQKGRSLLAGVVEAPSIETKVLVLKSMGLSEEQFFASPERKSTSQEKRTFDRLLHKRLSGIPFAYVVEEKEFWSLPLRVRRGVFIPRPETELLVEKVVELSSRKKEIIVDIGTGAGNIAVALASELPKAKIVASDISARALKTAEINARRHKVKRITFVRGDLFTPLERLGLERKCVFLVSNPPYVPASDWKKLPAPLRDHEPRLALVPGKTGLEFIRRLIQGAPDYLRPGGFLLFEIGYGQAGKVLPLFDVHWTEVESFTDLSGIPRVIKARKK